MKPDDPSSSQSGIPLLPQRSFAHPQNSENSQSSQEAAAHIIRMQIDKLYDNGPDQTSQGPTNAPVVETTTPLENINPYQRTHTQATLSQTNDWKQYHTAWQNYYQKYYEGYYNHQLKKSQSTASSSQDPETNQNETFTTKDAVFDLRQKLIGKIQTSAHKVKKSRHFVPILAGIIVLLFFLFLQYNQVIVSNVVAYISPGNIDPQNIVVDPNAEVVVSADPKLIIPKINVDVPVIYDIGNDYDSQMDAMTRGVAHFAIPGADSHPGQIGNTVIAGHSSNDLFDSGEYKFIFAQLDKLVAGDTVYINYSSVRYTYVVTKKEVVKPTEVSKLVYETTKPILTLLTCTPLGTATNRLLVTAEQVNPDPEKAVAASTTTATSATTNSSIPGSAKTLLEKIFGSNN